MKKLKQYKIVGFVIYSQSKKTYNLVSARVSAFCRKDAINVAYDHFHMIFPTVREL